MKGEILDIALAILILLFIGTTIGYGIARIEGAVFCSVVPIVVLLSLREMTKVSVGPAPKFLSQLVMVVGGLGVIAACIYGAVTLSGIIFPHVP